jgi:Uma2 family endonuclease
LHYSRFRFNDDEFYEFCQQNGDLKLERDANGTILIMPNTGRKTGKRNAEIIFQLTSWNKRQKAGEIFDSSTAFKLPSTAVRSADAAFVSHERWEALSEQEQEQFPPLTPDFVIELMRNAARSKSDSLKEAKAKMQNGWTDNGCQLGWLIDPFNQTTHIYRADGSIQINRSFDQPLSGEDVLTGLQFDLSELTL